MWSSFDRDFTTSPVKNIIIRLRSGHIFILPDIPANGLSGSGPGNVGLSVGNLWYRKMIIFQLKILNAKGMVASSGDLQTFLCARGSEQPSSVQYVLYVQEIVIRIKYWIEPFYPIEFMWPKIILLCKQKIFNLKYRNC